jgi:hypothetical protein
LFAANVAAATFVPYGNINDCSRFAGIHAAFISLNGD